MPNRTYRLTTLLIVEGDARNGGATMNRIFALAVAAMLATGGTANAVQELPVQARGHNHSQLNHQQRTQGMRTLQGSHLAAASRTVRPAERGRWRGPCGTWLYGERLTPVTWAADPARGERMMTRLVVCVFDHFAPGNSTYALAIAQRESGLYPWAQNVSSLCSGLFQHILSAWPSRAASYLPRWAWGPGVQWPDDDHPTRLVFDPRANSMAAAKMVAAGGWGPWGG